MPSNVIKNKILVGFRKLTTTTDINCNQKHDYLDLSSSLKLVVAIDPHIRLMISSTVLGYLGLRRRARISFGDQPTIAYNSIRPLKLNYGKMKNIFPTSLSSLSSIQLYSI